MKGRRRGPCAFSTVSIAAVRLSRERSERFALKPPSGSGQGDCARASRAAMLPFTPGP